MKKHPVYIRKTIPHSKWAIPVSDEHPYSERKLMDNWDEYCKYLEKLGFQNLLLKNKEGRSHIPGDSDITPQETYGLWHHPAGLLLHANSYTTGGWRNEDGTMAPIKKTLSSATVNAKIDIGVGNEARLRSSVSINGSGGNEVQLDGSTIRYTSDSFHSHSGTLAAWLMDVQPHGKFIPLEQWNSLNNANYVYLPNELLGGEQKDKLTNEEIDKRLSDFCAKLPASIGDVIYTAASSTGSLLKKNKKHNAWMKVKDSLDYFSEILGLSRICWRNEYDTALLKHWHEVVLDEWGKDPEKWRAYEIGPANLSLPIAMIYAQRNTESYDKLMQLLETAPEDALRRWATVPDAGGYTLALHAINRQFCDRVPIDRAPDPRLGLGVLSCLYKRLGAEGIVLETKKRSVLGLPMQYLTKYCVRQQDPTEISNCMEDYCALVQQLEEWGLPWHTSLKWRNYTNITDLKKPEKPCFFDFEALPTPQDMQELLGNERDLFPQALGAMLAKKQLEIIAFQEASKKEAPPHCKAAPRM